MIKRFDNRIGAALLIALGAIYLTASMALGRPATAEPPPDLSLRAADAGVDVLRAVGAALNGATFVDVRSASEYTAYHITGATNVPGATAAQLRARAHSGPVIVIDSRDAGAQKLVGAARAADPAAGRYFFLQSGVRDWYLTFELPVALFNEQAPPRGYSEALLAVKEFVATRNPSQQARARMALFDLARMNYQPSLLAAAGTKPKTAAGPRKKISGGCGG